MTDQNELQDKLLETLKLDGKAQSLWDEPVVCRVEVDLPGWLTQLAGGVDWEVCGEEEDENCISFAMREVHDNKSSKALPKMAEVTLYHNGYAVVDVDGESLFDGSLTSGTSDCAHLSYYNANSGEPIVLN
jgi:hypothetical protein